MKIHETNTRKSREYMKIAFATESISKAELSIKSSNKDEGNDVHDIKVMKVENSFVLVIEVAIFK